MVTTTAWYFSFWLLAVPFLFLYTYRFQAYELIGVGLLLDMQFLPSGYIPYYTLFFTSFVICAEWIKPQLRARSL
jgi:hypothetical protein